MQKKTAGKVTNILKNKIKRIFSEISINEDEIMEILLLMDGFNISARQKTNITCMVIILRLSFSLHSCLENSEEKKMYPQYVIDGDFLGTQYLELMIDSRENELNRRLISAYKKMIINNVIGQKIDLLNDTLLEFLKNEAG